MDGLVEIGNGIDLLETIKEFPYIDYEENETFLHDYSIESPGALSLLLGLLNLLHYECQGTNLTFTILFGNHWLTPTHSLENCKQKVYGLGACASKFSHITLHLFINITEENELLEAASSELVCSFFKGYLDNADSDSLVDEFKTSITPLFCNENRGLFQRFIEKTRVSKLTLVSNKIHKKQEKCHSLQNLLACDSSNQSHYYSHSKSWFKRVEILKIHNMTLTDSSCEKLVKLLQSSRLNTFSLNNCFYLPDKHKPTLCESIPWNGLFSRGVLFCPSIKTLELKNMNVLAKKDPTPRPLEISTTKKLFLMEMQKFFLKNKNRIHLSLKGFNIPFLFKDWTRFFKILKKSRSLENEIDFSNSKVRIPALFLFEYSQYIFK